MSIDWVKAEERPDKKQRVKGENLMDLRIKINKLEKQLRKKLNTVENLSSEMYEFGEEVSVYKQLLSKIDREIKRNGKITQDQFYEMLDKFNKKDEIS
ncbi:MAG: hypothetical protein GF317_05445 [Candidatus Lokiarchaeota archaeon]|nr:hypothetical protein [Candidatus Lokiarchaeota archaeon]MBD3199252.1 hypothetical protein [Candidatus Lokiarchaeota archaeon]